MRVKEMHPLCCISLESIGDQSPAAATATRAATAAAACLLPSNSVGSDNNAGKEIVSDVNVAGVLYKWTNYGKGWRSRWFLLRNGVVSYSKSRRSENFEDVRVIGDVSSGRLSRLDSRGRRKQHNKSVGFVHLKISSFRESKADDRRFYIFTATKTLHLRTDSRKDRVAWIQALVSTRSLFSLRPLSDEKLSLIPNDISMSTRKLRKRLIDEGIDEVLVRDCEQIVLSEFSELQGHLKVLCEERSNLLDTLRQLEAANTEVEASGINENQFRLTKHEYTGSGRGKFSECSTTESSDDIERQELEEISDEDKASFFDTKEYFCDSTVNCGSIIGDADHVNTCIKGEGHKGSIENMHVSSESSDSMYPHVERRTKLPDPIEKEKGVSLWSMIKDNVGKDLTQVCLPVYFNEPISSLQKCFEDLEYSYLLDRAYEHGKKVKMGRFPCYGVTRGRNIGVYSTWEKCKAQVKHYVGANFRGCDSREEALELSRNDVVDVRNTTTILELCRKPEANQNSTPREVSPSIIANVDDWKTIKSLLGILLVAMITFVVVLIAIAGNSLLRILNVAAFAVSGYASSEGRHCKPFNPLLGETYEADYPEKGVRFFSEKVSHHPTLIACHCEGRGWKFWGDSNLRTKFWGRSIQLDPVGVLTLEFDDGEIFQWNKVTTAIYNLILGKIYCDHHGIMHIRGNREHSCKLKFKEQSILDRNPHQVQGSVEDTMGNKVATLFGKWDDSMYYIIGDGAVRQRGSSQLTNAELLWKRNTPPQNLTRYNLTSFAITLNELTSGLQEKLPPTDSRLRPDQRHLENGEYEKANAEKLRLEMRQRMSRKLQENGWKPRWFQKDTENGAFRYVGGYWEAREQRKWDECPQIFGELMVGNSCEAL